VERPLFEAGRWWPEQARFNGMEQWVVYAFIRGLNRHGLDLRQMSDDDIASMNDTDLGLLPGVGPKIIAHIRTRFPYRQREAV
jgi:hypothetical protein